MLRDDSEGARRSDDAAATGADAGRAADTPAEFVAVDLDLAGSDSSCAAGAWWNSSGRAAADVGRSPDIGEGTVVAFAGPDFSCAAVAHEADALAPDSTHTDHCAAVAHEPAGPAADHGPAGPDSSCAAGACWNSSGRAAADVGRSPDIGEGTVVAFAGPDFSCAAVAHEADALAPDSTHTDHCAAVAHEAAGPAADRDVSCGCNTPFVRLFSC